jgi:hypothetical protein
MADIWIGAAPEWSSFVPEEMGGIELFWADPYPANAAIIIFDHADFDQDGAHGLEMGFDFYIDNLLTDCNIICKYDPADAIPSEFFFGIFKGKLAFQVWDTAGTAFGSLDILPGEFVGKWMRCYMNICSANTPSIVLMIAPMGFTGTEARNFNGLCGSVGPNFYTYKLAAFPGTTRSISTNNILCSPEGRIRNLCFSSTGSLSPSSFFNTSPYPYIYMLDHYYPLNDDTTGAGTAVDTAIAGWDGDYDPARVDWDNHDEDLTMAPSDSWENFLHFGSYGNVAIVDRTPLTVGISSIQANRSDYDARNVDNYSIPDAPNLLSASYSTTGTVFEFADNLKVDKRYTVNVVSRIDAETLGGAPVTINPGYLTSFSISDSQLPDYAVDKVTAGVGALLVKFNFNIRPHVLVSGIDVAWVDYSSNSITIWTNDSGQRTVTISGIMDTAGNILDTQTFDTTLQSASRTFMFNGKAILEKFVVKDDLESKVSRNARNYVEAELE